MHEEINSTVFAIFSFLPGTEIFYLCEGYTKNPPGYLGKLTQTGEQVFIPLFSYIKII